MRQLRCDSRTESITKICWVESVGKLERMREMANNYTIDDIKKMGAVIENLSHGDKHIAVFANSDEFMKQDGLSMQEAVLKGINDWREKLLYHCEMMKTMVKEVKEFPSLSEIYKKGK
jgi:hypothetical protein